MAVGNWFNGNVVAVIVIEEEQVVVAATGWEGEPTCEVTVAATSGGPVKDGSKDSVGSGSFFQRRWGNIGVGQQRKLGVRWFGGPKVLADLFEVRFGWGNGIGGVLPESLQGQAGESFQLAVGGQG